MRADAAAGSSGAARVPQFRAQAPVLKPVRRRRVKPGNFLPATLAVAITTAVAIALRQRVELANIIMLYLLLVAAVSSRADRAVAIWVSVLSVAAFDFFCVPPYLTFNVADARYFPVFGVMLLVALATSTLTTRLREEADASRQAEQRTAALLEISRDLAFSMSVTEAIEAGTRRTSEVFDARVGLLMPGPAGELRLAAAAGGAVADTFDETVARRVHDQSRAGGTGTGTLVTATALYLPLVAAGRTVGVLAVRPRSEDRLLDPEQRELMESFAAHIAAVVERANVKEAERRAEQALELSRLKSEFVSTASHELRTPLTSLALNVDLLEESLGTRLGGHDRELLEATRADTTRLRSLADDLLDLAKLEAGRMAMHFEPAAVRKLLESPIAALDTLAEQKGVRLTLDVRDTLPRVNADADRIHTVVSNLVMNAIRHTQPGGTVLVSADHVGTFVQVSVTDSGSGIPLEDQAVLFEKFSRPAGADERVGTGLGLAISRQIVLAHGGVIWVDSGPGSGSVFSFTLPVNPSNGET
jgi:two-component system sensor histidine kinase KdpD